MAEGYIEHTVQSFTADTSPGIEYVVPFSIGDKTDLLVTYIGGNPNITEPVVISAFSAVYNSATGSTSVVIETWPDGAESGGGNTVRIARVTPVLQELAYGYSEQPNLPAVERQLDHMVRAIRELQLSPNIVRTEDGDGVSLSRLPSAPNRKSKFFTFGVSGDIQLLTGDEVKEYMAEEVLKGDTGATGETGAAGADGVDGAPGENGESGAMPLSPVTQMALVQHQTLGTANQQLTIWTVGDSMMSRSRLPLGLEHQLHYRVPIIGYALEALLHQTVSGTIDPVYDNANGTERFDLWDYGRVWRMSTGAVLRVINSNGGTNGILSDKSVFYFSAQPGGGTATIERSRDGGSTWYSAGSISTDGTAGSLVRATNTDANSQVYALVRITATGGPVNFIGCKLWDSSRSGVIIANSYMGGARIDQTSLAPASVRNTIAADLGTVVLISQFREGAGELTQGELDAWLDQWETAIPNGEIVLVEQLDTPSLAENSESAVVNAMYRAAATARTRVRTYDINTACGSEAERDARGFYQTSVKGTVTANAGTDVLTCSGTTGFSVGGEITFTTTGTLPAPLQPWTMDNPKRYFVKSTPSGTTFTVSETNGGPTIDITDTGSGTHSVVQTDTIHMSDDAWRFVGSDIAEKLINDAAGVCVGKIYRAASGSREAIFGGQSEEHAITDYAFRMGRTGRGRFGIISKTSNGGVYRLGFVSRAHNDTFADGALLEFSNDGGYKTPLTIDGNGYLYIGPYNATTQSGYTAGARAVVEEDGNTKSCIAAYHKGNSPTVPVLRVGANPSGTRTDKFQVWADGKISQFPPASGTPATNGELVVEATSNTTLTFKLKGSDGTVRTGTITLA